MNKLKELSDSAGGGDFHLGKPKGKVDASGNNSMRQGAGRRREGLRAAGEGEESPQPRRTADEGVPTPRPANLADGRPKFQASGRRERSPAAAGPLQAPACPPDSPMPRDPAPVLPKLRLEDVRNIFGHPVIPTASMPLDGSQASPPGSGVPTSIRAAHSAGPAGSEGLADRHLHRAEPAAASLPPPSTSKPVSSTARLAERGMRGRGKEGEVLSKPIFAESGSHEATLGATPVCRRVAMHRPCPLPTLISVMLSSHVFR